MREDFPILQNTVDGKQLIYFDAACTYLKNSHTISGINKYYMEYSCCSGDRESSLLGSRLLEEINEARSGIKDFLGASSDDHIIITSGTTDSINKLIFSLDEKKITTLITSDLEHNSNFLPQSEYAKQKNIDFKIFSYEDILNFNILENKLSNIQGTFLFCFTHSSNIIGGNFNIKAISDLVHKYGGYILVDDAQYISYHRENVIENNIDFLAFSGHKIGGPTGIGILYVKKGSDDIMKYSSKVGGGTIQSIEKFQPKFKKLPYILEGGVQDFAGILGLKSCIGHINKIGIGNIHNHVCELSDYFVQKLGELNLLGKLKIISQGNASLVSIIPENFNVIDFHGYCNYFIDNYTVAFRTGTMCADNYVNTYLNGEKNIMRFSFGIYNTKEEIDVFLKILFGYITSNNLQ